MATTSASCHDFAAPAYAGVERELRAFIAVHGQPGAMPTQRTLERAGRRDLANSLRVHGGLRIVAQRLGLAATRKPFGYWQDPAVVERELRTFVAAHGEPGVMPSHSQLAAATRDDLAVAITRGEGMAALAARLGLRLSKHPPGYWQDWERVAEELLAFVATQERPDLMPTPADAGVAELLAAKRFDLYYALGRHGGMLAAAERVVPAYAGMTVRKSSQRSKRARRP